MPAAHSYTPRRAAASRFVSARGLSLHLSVWGDAGLVRPDRPPLVMLHGWMDVGASFQFVVDALAGERFAIAPDWRGFGRSDASGADSYWFPDYLADLEAVLDAELPGQTIDLLGHSMGGNVAMLYAGVRPTRVRRLVNLEGFGLPENTSDQAPHRYAKWLDELKQPAEPRPYDSLDAVVARLRKTNPRLPADKAAWLAAHWAHAVDAGHWQLRADPAHTRVNPILYRKEEVLACWKRISAPLLWVEGDASDMTTWWGRRYPRSEFDARLAVVAQVEKKVLSPAGHMLHHDQPEALAAAIEAFLDRA